MRGVGILLGWIVQKRWLTLVAVFLCLLGLVVIPHLPAPLNVVWVVLPGILFAAISYEGSGFLLGPSLYVRTRLLYAICAGTAVLLLAVGVAFADSNPRVLLVAFVGFIVVWFSGSLPIVVTYQALVRRQRIGRANSRRSDGSTS